MQTWTVEIMGVLLETENAIPDKKL
jgi:hypothetical protein